MGIVTKTLTPAEIAAAQNNASSISDNATAGIIKSNQFTFFAAFDGTRNNIANVPISGNPNNTNVAELFKQVENSGNSSVKSKYYRGPDGEAGTDLLEAALPTSQLQVSAEQAYEDFKTEALNWLNDNPGGSINVAMTAFSRGVGAAAFFSQILYERGLVDDKTRAVIIPPGSSIVKAGVMFDPVLTGVEGNVAFVGVQNVVSLRADNEYRVFFKSTDLSNVPGVTVLGVAGNHGGVGGGEDNGLAALTLAAATEFFSISGMSIDSVASNRAFNPAEAVIRDEGNVRLGDGTLVNAGGSNASYGSVLDGIPRQNGTGQTVAPPITQHNADGSTEVTFTTSQGHLLKTREENVAGGGTLRTTSQLDPSTQQVIKATAFEVSGDGLTQTASSYTWQSGSWTTLSTTVKTPSSDDSFSLTTTYPDGRVVEKTVGDDGKLFQTSTTTRTSLGSETVVTDGKGAIKYNVNRQTYDDGSAIEITTTPDGKVITKSYDTDGALAGTITDTPDGNGGFNRHISTVVDGKTLDVDQHIDASKLAEDTDHDGDFVDAGDADTTSVTIDGQDALYSDAIEDDIDAQYQDAEAIIAARNSGQLRQTVTAGDASDADGWEDPSNTDIDIGTPGEPDWYETANAQSLGGSLTQIQNLIAALKSGKPLPIATSYFNVVAGLSGNADLIGINQGLGQLSSLFNFADAIKRGDNLAALSSGASFVRTIVQGQYSAVTAQIGNNFGNLASAKLASEEGNKAAQALMSQYESVGATLKSLNVGLAVLNISKAFSSDGSGLDKAQAIVGLAQALGYTWAGPVGWALAAFSIFSSLFGDDEPPQVYGRAQAVSSQDGMNVYASVTENSNDGGAHAASVFNSLVEVLETTFSDTAGLGLVAQRLPSLFYYSNQEYFTLTYTDADTGQSHVRRYGLDGGFTGYGSTGGGEIANDPDFFKAMGQQFAEAALQAGAVVPQWMVNATPKTIATKPINTGARGLFDSKSGVVAANGMVWGVAA